MSSALSERPREGSIRAVLDNLIRQRHRLEASATEPDLLAANRRSILYWQQELSRCRASEGRATPPPGRNGRR